MERLSLDEATQNEKIHGVNFFTEFWPELRSPEFTGENRNEVSRQSLFNRLTIMELLDFGETTFDQNFTSRVTLEVDKINSLELPSGHYRFSQAALYISVYAKIRQLEINGGKPLNKSVWNEVSDEIFTQKHLERQEEVINFVYQQLREKIHMLPQVTRPGVNLEEFKRALLASSEK